MSFYTVDLDAWSREQAELIRQGRLAEADLATIAESLEDMSNSARHSLRSHLRVLLAHLLKYHYQPESRSRSWRLTIETQRDEVEAVLEESPSLRAQAAEYIRKAYPSAVRLAAKETELAVSKFPSECPFSLADVLNPDYYPEP